MTLSMKRENQIIPNYSLTGDLLSFLRCGLQYRYLSGSSLPPSRPVQVWFGEFIHGVMENAYRIWVNQHPAPPFPWPLTPTIYGANPPTGRLPYDIGAIGDIVESTLKAQGKNPRSSAARQSAYQRVERAVNELGPHLFPLISTAEEKVIGSRVIPPPPPGSSIPSRANLYELHGVIDVVSDVQLSGATSNNFIRQAVQNSCPRLTGRFEVIVDYKGSRRPPNNHPYWHQGDWQIQTYAWLRTRQPNSLNVVAGVLIYVNELAPAQEDLVALGKEIRRNQTDVFPARGSQDAYMFNAWQRGNEIPQFSLAFRFARAMRVIPINQESQRMATCEFDRIVLDIERCVANECISGTIINHWNPNGDDDTCAACDFRYFCPNPSPRSGPHIITAPPAP